VKNIESIGTSQIGQDILSRIYSYAPRSTYPGDNLDPNAETKRFKWPTSGVQQTASNTNIIWQEFAAKDDCYVEFGAIMMEGIWAGSLLKDNDGYILRLRAHDRGQRSRL
jgi:hypothetical protein